MIHHQKLSLLTLLLFTTVIVVTFVVTFAFCRVGLNNNNHNKANNGRNTVNNRPVIGILAQPLSSRTATKNSYIAASYVKYLEGAGARVVPIPYDLSKSDLMALAKQLNGVLFPGGGTSLNQSPYQHLMEFFLDYSTTSGVYFPIWATCLGFEGVAIAVAGHYSILRAGFDSWNISMPLVFHPNAETVRNESRLFGRVAMPSDAMFQSFHNEAITLNNHQAGVTVSDWFANANLKKFFRVLSVNEDRKGVPFISTFEAYDYPIYGTQWHPEKVGYEWVNSDINHSYSSLLANQHMAFFFVNECRKNLQSFGDENALLNRWLIYNYSPTYTFLENDDFMQRYYFAAQKV